MLNKRKVLIILAAAQVAALFCSAAVFCEEKREEPVMRVLVLDGKDRIQLTVKTRYKIYGLDTKRVLMEGAYLNTNVESTKDGLRIGERDLKAQQAVKVKGLKDANIYVNGRRFRGELDIVRKDGGKLMAINHIPLEDYLTGVLYHEVSHRWPLEALKAQAIASRTFAVYQAAQNKMQPYDLRSDIYSQVYGGRASEKWSTTRAVKLTRGKVLVFGLKALPSYFHATCAGHTEDASNLWATDSPPLKGVPCDFCKNSPHYNWRKDISLAKLTGALKDNGYNIGKISAVTILSRNTSGRADKIEFKDDSGVAVILKAKDFRQMMGPNDIRSTRLELIVKDDRLVVTGTGWGHGVGMCQWGAFGMSKKRKTAEEILKYYYPGAEITTLDKI